VLIALLGAGGAIMLFLGGWFYQSQRQDLPRANDRVLASKDSPDGRFTAFIVMREADSLSADVIKVFVTPRGGSWNQGKMLLVGRRFSSLGELDWLRADRLCLLASSDGVEEQVNRAWISERDLRFQVQPDGDACERASWA
jgi:hypothetical protein